MTVTLKALQTSVFQDDKDGMLGLRVAHFLESATAKPKVLRDANGIATPVAAPTAGATGVYRTSEGKVGADAWGTRARWCELPPPPVGDRRQGRDHRRLRPPLQSQLPHLLARPRLRPLRRQPARRAQLPPHPPALNFTLAKGNSATFHYRIILISGAVTPEALNHQSDAFNSK